MTTTADSPLLPRPLEAEHHELPVHNGFLAGMHSHLPHPHGTPQTVTTKSISDQTAQYVEALKREAFGKHPEQNPGEKDVRDSEPQMGDRDVVTQVLDNSDSVRVAGGTGKYFQSNDDTLSTSEQRRTAGASSGTHGSDMNGTGSRTDGLKGIPSQVDDAQLFDGFSSTAQNAVSHPDSNGTAQINPFHKLSFPDGGSPPWITKPLVPIEGGLQSDLSSAPLVHIKRVSRDTVVLVPATPAIEQTSDLASTLQAGQTSTHFLQKNGNSQQLEMTNGQLAIMTRQEERKTGFFSRFERAFGRSGNDQHTSDIPLPDGGIQVRSSQLPDSGDFLRQGPLGDDSTEVQGNAPPSPPISDHDTGVENNNAASSVQTRPFHAFQPLGDMRVISPLAEPFYGNVEAHGQYGNGGLPPLPKSTSLSVVSIVDGTSSQRSISGQSYTAEPETMNDVEETQQGAIAASRARLRPSVNTTMLEGVNSRNSVASASGSPTDSAATPADKTVVLAPPILTGTTRSGSIAAIKRGLGKASNATGSRQTSTAGSSLIDMESRVPSPVSLQAVGRRMSSDRYSQKGRQSLEQYAQNGLGLGIPANPAQGPVNSTAPPPASQSPPLQPPINPGRRNTTSGFSSPKAPNRNPLISSQSQLQIPQSSNTSSGFTGGLLSPKSRQMTDVPGLNGPALDPDILAEADRLRKERLNRRQRRRSGSGDEAIPLDGESPPGAIPSTSEEINGDAIPARSQSQTKYKERQLPTEQDRVLVGNLIGEDHVNYVLMYNMLTGIRIGVSRCQAKVKRPVIEEDYTAKHKYSFDIVGNELTPSARYDFKFKDYAPWVFRELREDYFHLDPADYLLSLTAKYILSELGSPGKSGSFFYFSRDYRFIIKTIHHAEHKYLRSILKDYHHHVKNNPHTLLSRFYGLHRVKLPRGRKIHFVIMNNLFPPHRDIHETYDLKGSTWGREYPEEKAKQNSKATLKDLNWLRRGRTFELGPEKRALFSEQLRRDTEFLKMIGVMDYSLLIGIHNMERGNRDNLRENQLSVFHPDVGGLVRRKPSSVKGNSEAAAVRKIVKRSDPKAMSSATQELPTIDSTDRRHFLFYQDEGGLRATDEANQAMDIIYYLGVIDILTPYNTVKRLEHLWRGTTIDRHTISCVPPQEYGERFLKFLLSFMRGADPNGRLKTE